MRRFIAGARCPKCEKPDTLYIDVKSNNNIVNCCACEYTMNRPQEAEIAKNKASTQEAVQAQVLHFKNPPKKQ